MSAGQMLIYPGGNQLAIEDLTEPPGLDRLQALVGGSIEQVPGFNSIEINGKVAPCVVYVNEDGKGLRLALNMPATSAWQSALDRIMPRCRLTDYLCGPVVVLTGDAKFRRRL